MPLICQPWTTCATAPLRVAHERQLVDEAHLQHVRPVEPGAGVVAVDLRRLAP